MGAVLQQRVQGVWQPLAFFSRKLSPAQQKHSAYDRELLAIYGAVRYFRHMLEARHFSIFTDHKPLTFDFHQKRDKCSPRQFNHIDFISQFTTDIRHISGQDNIVAYALSRVETITAPVTHDALAAAQDDDDELRALLVTHPYSSRHSSSLVPMSSCIVTLLLVNHVDTSHLPSAVRYSIPCIPSATPNQGNGKARLPTLRVASHAKRLPHLDPSLSTLPSLQSISPHHHSSWRLPPPSCPLTTYSHRPALSPTVLGRI
jgi:hypothetical protein